MIQQINLITHPQELNMEEDDSDIEDPFQDLANEDADSIQRGA